MISIIGIIGLILISWGIVIKKRKDRDSMFVIGGFLLLIYSISILDTIFIILQCVFILSAIYDITKKRRKKK